MANKIELDQFHWHEALDRTHLVLCNIDDFLIQHPVLKLNPKIRKHVEKASESLTEAYSMLGEESLNK